MLGPLHLWKVCLRWIWERAKAWYSLEEPEFVTSELEKCVACATGGTCSWMSARDMSATGRHMGCTWVFRMDGVFKCFGARLLPRNVKYATKCVLD